MDIMRSWLEGTDAHWNNTDNMITFPSGAQLKFGYFRNENDKDQYQGANYHFIGVDELTQFDESQYLWLMSRNRAPSDDTIPLRMWNASNPGSRGHAWVKQRFIAEGNGKRFIQSRLRDNPYLDYDEYAATLMNLDPTTRKQLLEGNWDIVAGGGYFQRQWFKIEDSVPIGTRVRFWDMAATPKTPTNDPDYTSGALVTLTKDGVYYINHIVRTRDTAQNVERLIRQTADIDGPEVAIVIEQEPGSSGLQVIDYYRRTVLQDRNLHAFRPTGPKDSRIAIVSSHAEGGNLHLVRGSWISDFLDEAELYPEEHDDQLDSVAGAIASLQTAHGRRRVSWIGGGTSPTII
jgi:predicted phage terminase large subunit-like protein